jgi:signal recognition particle subunit SRP54
MPKGVPGLPGLGGPKIPGLPGIGGSPFGKKK